MKIVKNYVKIVIALVVGYLICMFIGAGNACAANESYIEGGVKMKADAIDNIQTESSTFYFTTYKNLHRLFDVELNLDTTLDDGAFSEVVNTGVTTWVTPVKRDAGRVRCGLTVLGSYADKDFSIAREGIVDCNGRLNF